MTTPTGLTLAVSLVVLIAEASVAVVDSEEEDLGTWLAKNEPRVIAYLQALRPKEVGKSVRGVALSDGKREMKGYRYLGEVNLGQPNVHAHGFHMLHAGREFEVHYIWVGPGPSYNLRERPKCAGSWIEPGGWAVLSGDQYTSGHVDPGTLVVTTCRLGGAVAKSPPSNPALERPAMNPPLTDVRRRPPAAQRPDR